MSQSIKLFKNEVAIADDQFDLLKLCTEKKPESFLVADDYSRYLMSCMTTTYYENLLCSSSPRLPALTSRLNCSVRSLNGLSFHYFNFRLDLMTH